MPSLVCLRLVSGLLLKSCKLHVLLRICELSKENGAGSIDRNGSRISTPLFLITGLANLPGMNLRPFDAFHFVITCERPSLCYGECQEEMYVVQTLGPWLVNCCGTLNIIPRDDRYI